jgi:hypothetical protein
VNFSPIPEALAFIFPFLVGHVLQVPEVSIVIKLFALPVLETFDGFEDGLLVAAARLEAAAHVLRDEVELGQPLRFGDGLVLDQLIGSKRAGKKRKTKRR